MRGGGSQRAVLAAVGRRAGACRRAARRRHRHRPTARRGRRTARPDLSGIWQANNTANWDLEAHAAKQGPVFALGAAFSVPPGLGVVDGDGVIPYLPEALEKKKANGENWTTLDPEVKCYMPGIPRATYMPYPFQIVQAADNILMTYEFASASRVVRMNSKEKSPAPAWMGWSIGRWDGETLVIEVTDHMEETWFDRAGNHHSDALKVTERYTADRCEHAAVPGDDRGPEGVLEGLDDQHAALSAPRAGRAAAGIQVRGVRRRADVRAPAEEVTAPGESARPDCAAGQNSEESGVPLRSPRGGALLCGRS